MDKRIKLTETEKYGVVLTVHDYALYDEIHDFFTDNYHFFFNIGYGDDDDDEYSFWFGRTGCLDKIKLMLEKFPSVIPYTSDLYSSSSKLISGQMEITETEKYGVLLKAENIEAANKLARFLRMEFYANYKRFGEHDYLDEFDQTHFCFGHGASIDKVNLMLTEFENRPDDFIDKLGQLKKRWCFWC